MRIRFKVEQRHIELGVRGNDKHCAIALALADIGLRDLRVGVGVTRGEYEGVPFVVKTPPEMRDFIRAFDGKVDFPDFLTAKEATDTVYSYTTHIGADGKVHVIFTITTKAGKKVEPTEFVLEIPDHIFDTHRLIMGSQPPALSRARFIQYQEGDMIKSLNETEPPPAPPEPEPDPVPEPKPVAVTV